MADDEVWTLWPHGAPGPARRLPPETRFTARIPGGGRGRMLRNVSDPALRVFRPTGPANRAAVVVCPGGGWRSLAWEHEGEGLARRLADHGFWAFVLKYRLLRTRPAGPGGLVARARAFAGALRARRLAGRPPPSLGSILADPAVVEARRMAAEDGRRAMALIRARAGELGLRPDRVGMVGFSAGAYLVMDVVADPQGPPPAFVAPIYGGEIGADPAPADAPPLFAAVARDDERFLPAAEALFERWTQAGIPAELHVFDRGGHGFGVARQGLPVDGWVDRVEAWLAGLGLET